MELFERKIMLVDDHAELVRMIRDILKRNGYRSIVTA